MCNLFEFYYGIRIGLVRAMFALGLMWPMARSMHS
jgi:hypothetical protein